MRGGRPRAAFRQVLDAPRPPNGSWLKVLYVKEARRLKLVGTDSLRSTVRAEFLDRAGMNDAVMRDAWDSQPALEVHLQ